MDDDAQKIIKLSGVPYSGSGAECFMDKFESMSRTHPLDPKARIVDNCSILCMPSNGNTRIHISHMDSLQRGSGSIALKKICDLADECGVDLSLNAKGYSDTPTEKLVEWYSRYGFVQSGIGNKNDGYRMLRKFARPVQIKLKGFDRLH